MLIFNGLGEYINSCILSQIMSKVTEQLEIVISYKNPIVKTEGLTPRYEVVLF